MKAITIRFEESTLESIDAEADEHGRTRSEHVREVVRTRSEHDRIRAEYEERIADLERENERLRREKRQILEQRTEHTELVRAVEKDRTLAERKARAGLLTKAKWALVGMPGGDDE